MPSKAEIEAAAVQLSEHIGHHRWPELDESGRNLMRFVARKMLTAAEQVAWQDSATAPRDGSDFLWRDKAQDGSWSYCVIRWPEYYECFRSGEWRALEPTK